MAGQHHVLIVEDDEVMSMLYSHVLAENGINVDIAGSLEQAKKAIAEIETLDAVILDNQLGDGQGLVLVPLIQQRFEQCSILMISANLDGDFFLEAFAVGIDDYLTKPVNLDLLCLKLEKTLKNKELLAVTERQSQELALWVNQAQYEQELARHVFESLCCRLAKPHDFLQSCSKACGAFSGDLLLHQFGQDGSLYILLADSMGHGLAAAISLLPVLEVFQAMTHKGLPLAQLVYELNEKLFYQLPDDRFVAAVLLRVNPSFDFVEVWNGGMPSLLMFNGEDQLVSVAKSKHMALGILTGNQLNLTTEKFEVSRDMQLVGYTDGLLDNIHQDGRQLNESTLQNLWCSQQRFVDVNNFMQSVEKPDDDMAMFVLNFSQLHDYQPDIDLVNSYEGVCGLRFELAGHALLQLDITNQVIRLLQNCNMQQALCNKTFSVLTELFLNAFEHGVLGLSSALKQQEDGFLLYYDEKQRKSALLTNTDFVHFSVQWQHENNVVEIWMCDSGNGFAWTDGGLSEAKSDSTAGRGLSMIKSLCTSVDYLGCGNEVKVVING
jgi:two-component system, HptB-dependent secretion and biofilm response regulator